MEAACSSENLVNHLPDYTVSLYGRPLHEISPSWKPQSFTFSSR